ncbi:MAG TPA: GuaB3 family IMP dehydrogenase-related protein [Mycobacteriales bacterium]|nr:GuaB3 family IMP dehydrogenase-related protein [Mycobacteriales bacterium]
MRDIVEIGQGKTARRGYHLNEIALVPSRRTRASKDVSIRWQLDAHEFALPLVTAPSDAIISPASAALVDSLGGLAVLNGEGLWARYEDPNPMFEEIIGEGELPEEIALQRLYAEPVRPDLLAGAIKQQRDVGANVVAVRLSPQKTADLADAVLRAGADLLVIQGTVVSAEHVSQQHEPLNLKTFIADLDIPVIVGGCADYQTALHLMRTGAAGIIVGYGANAGATTPSVLGIDVPMATAIAEAAAARRDYLDETGGRYVHIIAHGDLTTSGDIAKAIGCGADAVMLGEPLAAGAEMPGRGAYWDHTVSHPSLPRSALEQVLLADERVMLAEVLLGPTFDPSGRRNLFGALRRAMAKCGYSTVKEFQRVELTLAHRG